MALIILRVYLSFLSFQVSSFKKSNCLDFIANDEWAPIHVPDLNSLDYQVWSQSWNQITSQNI